MQLARVRLSKHRLGRVFERVPAHLSLALVEGHEHHYEKDSEADENRHPTPRLHAAQRIRGVVNAVLAAGWPADDGRGRFR